MSTSRISTRAATTPSGSTVARSRKVIWHGLYCTPYGCPGHKFVNFHEDVLHGCKHGTEADLLSTTPPPKDGR